MRPFLVLVATLLSVVFLPTAKASFHFMQIYEVIGGVSGGTSAQAIELRMRLAGQNNFFSNNPKLVAVDAAGANPVTLITLGSNVAFGNFGSTVLITTSNFKNYTSHPAAFVN